MTDLIANLLTVMIPMAILAWLVESMQNASIEKKLKKPLPPPKEDKKKNRR
ncbi:MAG: hypothetical protein ACPGUC_08550 [Gammaproteobacteria bacterium]